MCVGVCVGEWWVGGCVGACPSHQSAPHTHRLKKRRSQAIAAKAIVNPNLPGASMATTPATNVACMKYNGGGAAETICMIDLSNPEAKAARPLKKPKTIKGISSIHYMQKEANGVRVWHVANVGVGKLVTWETIKDHHHGEIVVDPCVPLIHVPPAVDPSRTAENAIQSNEFDPKIHRSHRNVKRRKRERALRRESKKLTREHNYLKKVEDFTERVDQIKGLTCQWCFEVLSSNAALQSHQKNGCTRSRGRTKQERTVTSNDSTTTTNTTTPVPTVSTAPTAPTSQEVPTLTRGYAWVALRDQVTETVGPRARLLLEQAFQRGSAKGGDRQSCFQMVSTLHSPSRTHAHAHTLTHILIIT